MLGRKMKIFREYNKLDSKLVAKALGITEEEYIDYESNKAIPTIDIITTLASFYKITVNEFYGYTPRVALHSKEMEFEFDDVSENILKMSDLSWEEAEMILYYRTLDSEKKDEMIKNILEKKNKEDK